MQKTGARSGGDRLGQEDGEVLAAIRFAILATLGAVGFLLVAAVWVSTCPGVSVDTVACGPPQRTLLAFGGPLIGLARRNLGFRAHVSGLEGRGHLVGMARRGLVPIDRHDTDGRHGRCSDRRAGAGPLGLFSRDLPLMLR